MRPKHKISVTVSADVLKLVDRAARQTGSTRRRTIEDWLREAASRAAEQAIEAATAAHYAALRGHASVEGEGIARASSRAAAHVTYDARPKQPRRRRTS